MKVEKKKKEQGQALVLIAFAFVVLVGFTALSIDGGMVYSDRRRAQNASDAGSLGGGGAAAISMENNHVFYADFDCSSTDVNTAMTEAENAALNLMLANQYAAGDVSVTTACQDTEAGAYFEEKYIDITTEIITETRTSFVHFVFQGLVQNRVDATTRVKPRSPMAFGHAIVALNDNDSCSNNQKEGVIFDGNGDTDINGGGVWSNGCLKGVNNACDVDVVNGSIAYAGGLNGDCSGNMSPAPGFQSDQLPEDSYSVPLPDCSASDAITVASIGKNTDLDAGSYVGKTLICVTAVNNAIKVPTGFLYGHGKTIFLVNGGDISISGGDVDLEAPPADPEPDGGITGILIYVNPVRDSSITINGNSDSKYLGVIYAPRAHIKINGTSGTNPTFNTQIIGWNVQVSGTADIDINFNETWAYSKPTAIDLEE